MISYGGNLKFVLVYRPGLDASPNELDGPLVELIVCVSLLASSIIVVSCSRFVVEALEHDTSDYSWYFD